MQLKVDEVQLDNGTWRRLVDQFDIRSMPGNGQKTVVCKFIITGDTPTELNTRWKQTRDDFIKTNPRVLVWADSSTTTPTEDISWFDGRHTSIETRVSWDYGHTQTGLSIVCLFICLAQEAQPPSSDNSRTNQFRGQHGEIVISAAYSAGLISSRVVECQFVSTFQEGFAGPFTLTTVENDGSGKARFVFSGGPNLPTFKIGQKITITGTTNYNGTHEVSAINNTTDKITTTLPFGIAESGLSGTGTLGQPTTGLENYIDAREDILSDYLLVETDGGWNGTEGLALTGETIKQDPDGQVVNVTLASSYMVIDLTAIPSVRAFEMAVSRITPEKYDPVGGNEPTTYAAKGHFIVDKDALGSTAMAGLYALVDASIKSEVERQLGETVKYVSKKYTSSADFMAVDFELTFLASDVDVFRFNITIQEDEVFNFASHIDADGYDLVQLPPGGAAKTCIVTVERTGYGRIDLSTFLTPPLPGGGTYQMISRTKTYDSQKLTPSGDVIVDEAWSASYRLFRLRRNIGSGKPVIE